MVNRTDNLAAKERAHVCEREVEGRERSRAEIEAEGGRYTQAGKPTDIHIKKVR